MINVVGIGLDGAAGLSQKVLQIIDYATILIGSDRHLSYFFKHPATKVKLTNLNEIIPTIKQYLNQQEKIVILVSGDPLFFGLGRFLLTKFSAEYLQFYPHLNSVQLAFNKIKVPWQDAKIVSIHGRDFNQLINLLKKGAEKIAILTDNIHNPASILNLYKSLDIPVNYNFWLCENLGDDTEKITYYPEGKNLENVTISSLNIVILIRENQSQNNNLNLDNLPLLGLPDHLFASFPDRVGLMTKREIRLTILGELALQAKQVIWDIGAGTGSVSIEIARLCPSSQIYAIEKTAIGISLIEKNCHNFQVKNIIPIQGKAPNILSNLPAPHRIFIGGSSGNLTEILKICRSKLNKNGKIIIALATLENLQESINWFKQNQWNYKLLQVQISRSIPIANLTRFIPLNPVTIITSDQASGLSNAE